MSVRLLSVLSLLAAAFSLVNGFQLDVAPPSSQLCPVVKYETMVLELSPAQLSSMKLNAKLMDEMAASQANQAKPFQVILKPLSYAHNQSMPSVDWIDLHFKVNADTQQNVQMKLKSAVSVGLVGSSSVSNPSVAPELDSTTHMSMMPQAGQSMVYSFGPIFLKPTDELTYAHTICSNMIDCITESHSFKRQAAAAAPVVPPQQQPIVQSQPQQEQAQPSKQEILPPPVVPAPAPAPVSPSQPQQQEVPSATGCPAINYRYEVSCGDDQCKVSFINLTPEKPLDWVDIHLRTNSSSLTFGTPNEFSLQNYRMKLAAGVKGHMMSMSMSSEQSMAADMAQLNSPSDLLKYGAESSPSHLLSAVGGSQVWQFGLPIAFKAGDRLALWFTYCASGVDCDTEQYQLILKSDQELANEQQQQQQQQQQKMLLQHSLDSRPSDTESIMQPSAPQMIQQQLLNRMPSSISITTVHEQAMLPLSVALKLAHLNPNMPIEEFQRLAASGALQNINF